MNSASEKRAWALAMILLVLGVVVGGGASISRTRVLRMSDGMLVDRYAIGGLGISSVERRSVWHPLPVQPAEHPVVLEFELQRQPIWGITKTPSSYANRLVSECGTLRELLLLRGSSPAEAADIWNQVVAKATARQSIEPIIRELLLPMEGE